jgi:hypothetical protein
MKKLCSYISSYKLVTFNFKLKIPYLQVRCIGCKRVVKYER